MNEYSEYTLWIKILNAVWINILNTLFHETVRTLYERTFWMHMLNEHSEQFDKTFWVNSLNDNSKYTQSKQIVRINIVKKHSERTLWMYILNIMDKQCEHHAHCKHTIRTF